MALEIFKLVGSIFVDSDKANESMQKTDKKAQNVGETLSKSVGTAAKWGAGIATAAGAGVTALTAMAMKVGDTAGDIDDAAKRAGTTAEEYQKWAYAAKLGGMEATALEKAMVKQQKAFSDAKEGSKGLSEAYQRLGIDIEGIDDSSQAFDQVMLKLADMEDATERNALANDIFGKSYADLAPLFNEGSAGIEAWKNQAVELGAVMSNETVEASASLGDTIDALKASFGGIFNELGANLIPIVQTFGDMILANMPTIQGMFDALLPVLAQALSDMLPPLIQLVQDLLPVIIDLIVQLLPFITQVIEQVLPILVELITTLLPPILQIVEMVLPLLLELIKPLLPLLQPILALLQPMIDLLLALIEPLVQILNAILPPLIKVITTLISTALKPLKEAFGIVADILKGAVTLAFDSIKIRIDTIKGVFNGLLTFIKGVFTGNWKQAWQGVTGVFGSIFNGIKESFKAPINFVIKGINSFLGSINKIKIPDWVPGVGGYGFSIPTIPLLAKGGVVDRGQLFIANEQDGNPELVGSYGGKAAVMNNNQIIESVSDGVYRAVRDAMNGGGIDYEELAKAMQKVHLSVELESAFNKIGNKNDEFKKQTGRSRFA